MVVLGNRGKCAGPCRLPFTLLEDGKCINSGYLLNTRDLCGLDFLPFLIDAGVTCFKIEGRMKSPEYVATVTRIYRKYIDLALSKKEYIIEEKDRKDLLQIFNRGMSSTGHLSNEPNKQLVFKERPNHLGLFLGIVQKYNPQKEKEYEERFINPNKKSSINNISAYADEIPPQNIKDIQSKTNKSPIIPFSLILLILIIITWKSIKKQKENNNANKQD